MTRDWSILEKELAALQNFLRQPISARLSVLPVACGDEEDWLEAGTRAFDQAVSRVQAGVGEGIGQPFYTWIYRVVRPLKGPGKPGGGIDPSGMMF